MRETEIPKVEISDRAGFSTPEYMTTVIRHGFSSTPLRYRRDMRSR